MSNLLEVLKGRSSQRGFLDNKPIPRDQLEQIIDCARLAATARNVQPWEFVVVTEPGVRQQIAEIATTGKFNCIGISILFMRLPRRYGYKGNDCNRIRQCL